MLQTTFQSFSLYPTPQMGANNCWGCEEQLLEQRDGTETPLLTQLSSTSSDHFLPCSYAAQNGFFKFCSHVFWLLKRQTVHSFKHFLALQVPNKTMREDFFSVGYLLRANNSKYLKTCSKKGIRLSWQVAKSLRFQHCHRKLFSKWHCSSSQMRGKAAQTAWEVEQGTDTHMAGK